MKQLILGGVRSGQSQFAEQQALDSGLEVVYIATAAAGDEEMRRRIQKHQYRRPPHWQLVEEPLMLAESLHRHAAAERCLLVDCLTLWLTNLLLEDDEALFRAQRDTFVDSITTLPGQLVLVSNETGLGIVPMGEITRRYCDEAGQLHQELVQVCERVILTIAGLPHVLKETHFERNH
jgi:adenosylcobinamide kinase/adenosylcobinamide-phosphate guanylyltransferase